MAKTKKRAAARAKNARRGKASVKPARKKTVKKTSKKVSKTTSKKTTKRSTTKDAKSKVRRSAKRVTKPAIEELQPQQAPVPENAVELEKSVETTIVAVVEQPAVVALEEVVAVTTSAPAESMPQDPQEDGTRLDEDLEIWSGIGEAPEKKVA